MALEPAFTPVPGRLELLPRTQMKRAVVPGAIAAGEPPLESREAGPAALERTLHDLGSRRVTFIAPPRASSPNGCEQEVHYYSVPPARTLVKRHARSWHSRRRPTDPSQCFVSPKSAENWSPCPVLFRRPLIRDPFSISTSTASSTSRRSDVVVRSDTRTSPASGKITMRQTHVAAVLRRELRHACARMLQHRPRPIDSMHGDVGGGDGTRDPASTTSKLQYRTAGLASSLHVTRDVEVASCRP
jgi:hypothetical protein